MMKFKQVNLNHCRQAQDLLLHAVAAEKVDVVIASDPHGVTHGVGEWLTDTGTGRAAIGVFRRTMTIVEVMRDAEFVAARLQGDIYVFSCYVSPRYPLAHFSSFIQRLENCIRGLEANAKLVIAGDFNARSAAWGDWVTCARGDELVALADSLNLVVINDGSEPTFIGKGAGSIVDVTLVSESLVPCVQGWKVETGTDNGSDHQSIEFRVSSTYTAAEMEANKKGWDTSGGVNLDLFEAGLIIAEWITPERRDRNGTDPNVEAEDLEHLVSFAADFAIPMKREPRTHKAPAYWWTREIGLLRNACNLQKRKVRRAAASVQGLPADVLSAFREARKALRQAIRKSKAQCWDQLLRTVDKDPWGKPYKTVMRKLGGPLPTLQMERGTIERITGGLFPSRNMSVGDPVVVDEPPPLITMEELEVGITRARSRKRAPGPDGINTAILVALHQVRPAWLIGLFNRCLVAGIFPDRWKVARLVLLRKGTKPAGEPTSYRPLCLLNDVGKLLEFILVRRLETHVAAKGGLSDAQFGFRRGRSTVDAGLLLKEKALTAMNDYEMCVAISLDIRNAFNSIGWSHVMEALASWDAPPYCTRIFQSYFHDRVAEVSCGGQEGEKIKVVVSCGVPQGSVVGPFLWNITYDQVLRVQLPLGVSLIGFADDTLVMASGKTCEEVEAMANESLDIVSEKIQELDLSLAVDKTEAVMFRRKYRDRVPVIFLDGAELAIGRSIKHLGLIVDDNLSFKEHIKAVADKAQRVIQSLGRLMPNIGGPKEKRRRLLISVIHSIVLFGVPVWGEMLRYSKGSVGELMKVQRRAALRSISAYRTVSYPATNLIAGIPPIDLLAFERMALYESRKKSAGPAGADLTESDRSMKEDTLNRWRERLEVADKGAWTRSLVTDLKGWCSRSHGHVNYHLTQLLSGHGCFGSYLARIGKEADPRCHHCAAVVDDAPHTFFECPSWAGERALVNHLLDGLNLQTVTAKMVGNAECWQAVVEFAGFVMQAKEAAERIRRLPR